MDTLIFGPEPFKGFGGSCNCGCGSCRTRSRSLYELDDSELGDVTAAIPWDQWGTAYVKWLQGALNKAHKAKLAVTGIPDKKTISALQSAQHKMKTAHQRMGRVGKWTADALVKLGAAKPPTRPAPPAVGFDCAFDTRKQLACLKKTTWLGVPVSYAVRYYTRGYHVKHGKKVWACDSPHSKRLSPDEAKALTKAGIKIVSVWEVGNHNGGHALGMKDATCAVTWGIRCGQPADTPIYFAIDHDPKPSERAAVEAYFEGIRDGIAAAKRHYEIGIYGNRISLDWCKAQGIATWFWQSCSTLTANSTNQFRWAGVNIHQVKCEADVCSEHVDLNESDGREGGWFVPTTTAHELWS